MQVFIAVLLHKDLIQLVAWPDERVRHPRHQQPTLVGVSFSLVVWAWHLVRQDWCATARFHLKGRLSTQLTITIAGANEEGR